jgi:hypothetical protein
MPAIESLTIKADANGMQFTIAYEDGQEQRISVSGPNVGSDPLTVKAPVAPPPTVKAPVAAAPPVMPSRPVAAAPSQPTQEEYPALRARVHGDQPIVKRQQQSKTKSPIKLPPELQKRKHMYKAPGSKFFAPLPPELAAARELEDRELDARRAAYIAEATKKSPSQPSSPGVFRYATREAARLARLESNKRSRIKMKALRAAQLTEVETQVSQPVSSQPATSQVPPPSQDLQAIVDAAFKAAGIPRPPRQVSP